ncbi:plasmid mobilization relaxosome protein MobC [Ruminococcaceae bacterium OttesenSCG-928-L11]|nr:plasmid mobilization relaxosome protein MobC [Ruminococcaceae bacterium OttesenSCG-928-L11]
MNVSNDSHDRVISIRLLPEEAALLKAKAKEAHMSQARFLKNVLIYGGVYERTNFTREDRAKLQHELDYIGNNLNQIAIYAHSSKDIDDLEFLRLQDRFKELLSEFYDFICDRTKAVEPTE